MRRRYQNEHFGRFIGVHGELAGSLPLVCTGLTQRSGCGFESEPAIPLAMNSELDFAQRPIVSYRRDRAPQRFNIHLLPRNQRTRAQLGLIATSPDGPEGRLRDYVGLYREIITHGDRRLCPGGMLAAEAMTLPTELADDVRGSFRCISTGSPSSFRATSPPSAPTTPPATQ